MCVLFVWWCRFLKFRRFGEIDVSKICCRSWGVCRYCSVAHTFLLFRLLLSFFIKIISLHFCPPHNECSFKDVVFWSIVLNLSFQRLLLVLGDITCRFPYSVSSSAKSSVVKSLLCKMPFDSSDLVEDSSELRASWLSGRSHGSKPHEARLLRKHVEAPVRGFDPLLL